MTVASASWSFWSAYLVRMASIASMSETPTSMSRAGNCYDNAFMESCIGTVKNELGIVEYENRFSARKAIPEYITYYNTERIHSAIDYMTPVDFEAKHREKQPRRRRPK